MPKSLDEISRECLRLKPNLSATYYLIVVGNIQESTLKPFPSTKCYNRIKQEARGVTEIVLITLLTTSVGGIGRVWTWLRYTLEVGWHFIEP